MTITIKLPRQLFDDMEQENNRLTRKLAQAESKIEELKASLDTSRKLYSKEKQQNERASEAVNMLTAQNSFLSKALMRAMTNNKEAFRETKEEQSNHSAT